jgi:hypothetical protein
MIRKRCIRQGSVEQPTAETEATEMVEQMPEAPIQESVPNPNDSLCSQTLWWDSETEDPSEDLEHRPSDIHIYEELPRDEPIYDDPSDESEPKMTAATKKATQPMSYLPRWEIPESDEDDKLTYRQTDL